MQKNILKLQLVVKSENNYTLNDKGVINVYNTFEIELLESEKVLSNIFKIVDTTIKKVLCPEKNKVSVLIGGVNVPIKNIKKDSNDNKNSFIIVSINDIFVYEIPLKTLEKCNDTIEMQNSLKEITQSLCDSKANLGELVGTIAGKLAITIGINTNLSLYITNCNTTHKNIEETKKLPVETRIALLNTLPQEMKAIKSEVKRLTTKNSGLPEFKKRLKNTTNIKYISDGTKF